MIIFISIFFFFQAAKTCFDMRFILLLTAVIRRRHLLPLLFKMALCLSSYFPSARQSLDMDLCWTSTSVSAGGDSTTHTEWP